MLDEELRRQLAVWGESASGLSVPDVGVIARRTRRRRVRSLRAAGTALAATAGVVAIALVALPGAGPASNSRHIHRVSGWQPAGPPVPPGAGISAAPYDVTLRFQQSHAPAVITDALTGRVIATVRPPAGLGPSGFESVSAAADDRTFMLMGGHQPGGQDWLYELRLRPNGSPASLKRLGVRGFAADLTFAVSPDARDLAVVASREQSIDVISLATGKRSRWTAPARDRITFLAWAGPSRLLVGWFKIASALARRVGPSGGLSLLSVSGNGGSMADARLLVPATVRFGSYRSAINPLVSADGTAIFATMIDDGGPVHWAEVVRFSARTGRPLRAVSEPVAESGMGRWCGAVWTDPAARQAALVCQTEGVFSHGRFRARDLHVPMYGESAPTQAFIGW